MIFHFKNRTFSRFSLVLQQQQGVRLHLDQEHLGAGVPGADEVPPDQASADLAIVEFETP